MIVFRLSKSKYSKDLSGSGAEKAGGRWNSKGHALIYTSSSRALCVTEIAVHVPLGIVPKDYELISIELPSNARTLEIKLAELPVGWNFPLHSPPIQVFGNDFIASSKYLILKVPSAVVQGDFNYLLNPKHPDCSKVKVISIEPFTFDKRLFK